MERQRITELARLHVLIYAIRENSRPMVNMARCLSDRDQVKGLTMKRILGVMWRNRCGLLVAAATVFISLPGRSENIENPYLSLSQRELVLEMQKIEHKIAAAIAIRSPAEIMDEGMPSAMLGSALCRDETCGGIMICAHANNALFKLTMLNWPPRSADDVVAYDNLVERWNEQMPLCERAVGLEGTRRLKPRD